MGYRNIKKQKKLISLLQIEDFDFSMSRDNAYYQFYKNAPIMARGTLVSVECDRYFNVCVSVKCIGILCSYMKFVATVTTGGRKFFFLVKFFSSENNGKIYVLPD